MPTLREGITKTFQRWGRRARGEDAPNAFPDPSLAETTVATDPRHGRHYGSYRVLRRLGAGGMGSVYLALDTRLGRHAALKFLSPRLKSDPEMLARLQQEARTASSLNHPNILTIYDIAEAEGEPFIASEFVDGNTLRHALERNLVEPPAALDIARQIASALATAHLAGIVHRDLKPSNIMLRPDGLVKVIDFGLAKFATDGYIAPFYEPVSKPGSVAGTVEYMSPEQARGDQVDQRTDVWSLGVILYEMLSKRHPFEGATESHVIVAILDRSVSPFKPPAGIPVGIGRVLERALAKDAAKRYQSGSEFQAALDELQTPSQVPRGQRLFAGIAQPAALVRPRRIWPYCMAVALLLAVAVWWGPFYGRERVLGPAWFVPKSYEQVTHRGDVETATLSPDAKYVAYTTTQQDRNRIHLLNLATKAERMLPPFAGTILGMSFSPDSRSVYYTVHDPHEWGRLYSADVAGGEARFVLDNIDGPAWFSPNGRRFAFRRRSEDKRTNLESIISVSTDDTGDQQTIFSKYNTEVGGKIAWTPDGTNLAVMVQKTDLQNSVQPTLTLLTAGGRFEREVSSPFRLLSGPVWLNHGTLAGFIGVGQGDDLSRAQLRQYFATSGIWRAFPTPSLTVNSMGISQDGRTLSAVTLNKRGSLSVLEEGALDKWTDWPVNNLSVSSFAWSGPRRVIFAAQDDANLRLWQTNGPGGAKPISAKGTCIQEQPAAAPGKPLVIFSSNCGVKGNNSNLWSLNTSTGETAQITHGANFDKNADVAADGKTVVFDSWISNAPTIRKLTLGGGGIPAEFMRLQSRNPVLSPDGKLVACQVRENYDGLWHEVLANLADGVIRNDSLPPPLSDGVPMRFSPDSQSIDFVNSSVSDSEIWRWRIGESKPRLLLRAPGIHIADFRWSPNGTRVAMLSVATSSDVVLLHNDEVSKGERNVK